MEREKDSGGVSGRTQAENSDKRLGSIFVPSFQLKVPNRLHSCLLPEHVKMFI